MKVWVLAIGFLACASAGLVAQSPGVAIESNGKSGEAEIIRQAEALRDRGSLTLTMDAVKAQLESPAPGPVTRPAAATDPLPGRELARRARAAYVQLGWFFLCQRCDKWHTKLAGAYAIAHDTLVTCHHCVAPGDDVREGFLIAVDSQGTVMPVTAVLARSRTMDTAVLRVDGSLPASLPLSDAVAPGDPAYCFSAPLGQNGYFSDGIVNRFFWNRNDTTADHPDSWKHLRMNVSTDWAPGSSGAAVVDSNGNAIGHVATINPLRESARPAPADANKPANEDSPGPRDRFGGAPLITLHNAITARGVLALLDQLPKAEPAPAEPAPAEPAPAEPVPSATRAF